MHNPGAPMPYHDDWRERRSPVDEKQLRELHIRLRNPLPAGKAEGA